MALTAKKPAAKAKSAPPKKQPSKPATKPRPADTKPAAARKRLISYCQDAIDAHLASIKGLRERIKELKAK